MKPKEIISELNKAGIKSVYIESEDFDLVDSEIKIQTPLKVEEGQISYNDTTEEMSFCYRYNKDSFMIGRSTKSLNYIIKKIKTFI